MVHRRGIIDRKTVEGCPSLACRLGERVQFTETGLLGFAVTIFEYIGLIAQRAVGNLGVERPEVCTDYILKNDWEIGSTP